MDGVEGAQFDPGYCAKIIPLAYIIPANEKAGGNNGRLYAIAANLRSLVS